MSISASGASFVLKAKATGTSTGFTGYSVTSGVFYIVSIACDPSTAVAGTNTSTSVTSMSDTGGNTYVKRYEYSYQPSAAALSGVTVAIFTSLISTTVSAGTLTVNFAASTSAAKVVVGQGFSITSNSITLPFSPVFNGSTSSTPSLTSNTANIGDLLYRVMGLESAQANFTATTGWTGLANDNTSGGGAAANIASSGEFLITTAAQTYTSAPSYSTAGRLDILIHIRESVSTTPRNRYILIS